MAVFQLHFLLFECVGPLRLGHFFRCAAQVRCRFLREGPADSSSDGPHCGREQSSLCQLRVPSGPQITNRKDMIQVKATPPSWTHTLLELFNRIRSFTTTLASITSNTTTTFLGTIRCRAAQGSTRCFSTSAVRESAAGCLELHCPSARCALQ